MAITVAVVHVSRGGLGRPPRLQTPPVRGHSLRFRLAAARTSAEYPSVSTRGSLGYVPERDITNYRI